MGETARQDSCIGFGPARRLAACIAAATLLMAAPGKDRVGRECRRRNRDRHCAQRQGKDETANGA